MDQADFDLDLPEVQLTRRLFPTDLPAVGQHPAPVSAPPVNLTASRPRARGKFLFRGTEKLWIRGATYGPFRPAPSGHEFEPDVVERDFDTLAEAGLNAIRTYTVPPRWLLDAAQRRGLTVLVGLPWEEHVDFLSDKGRAADIERRIRAGVRTCAGHPAVLGYAIGNEIPAPIVRWCGARRVERFLKRLAEAVRAEDPAGLITYVNYPSTEYLDLPFLDFVSHNVYLESPNRFSEYLARLQTLAGDRPLVLAEIGLDSRRHGQAAQARALEWQIRRTFAGGCAGAFVFAWTDDWFRGGSDIDDWDFGLTDRHRRPKPALAAVSRAYAEVPFPADREWPRISVVICSYNGQRTIRDCLEGVQELRYPNFEAIVVDDGSTDATAAIAAEFDVRLIRTENRGLSRARNTGLAAATGQIVAYLDDDARPDQDWLAYLAATFLSTSHAGVGGPNLAPPGHGTFADCVANAPGGPIHVLISDQEAEHLPGCNLAFRREALEAIGGFDPRFRVAGDDVDVCWRIQEQGWTLGFSPAAVVWHRRRGSIRGYWKQQRGYARAEVLLERKWPAKYNLAGHPRWSGRVYNNGIAQVFGWRRGRIYQGTWGSAPFQSIHHPAPDLLGALPLMPEWYLVVAALALLAVLGVFWTPLLSAAPLLALAVGAVLVQVGRAVGRASFSAARRERSARGQLIALTAFLHLLQPLARLTGRLGHGLTPWRRSIEVAGLRVPRRRTVTAWSESWQAPFDRLRDLEASLQRAGARIRRGGDYDRWDLEVQAGLIGAVRVRLAVEEHGAGWQMIRWRTWPRCAPWAPLLVLIFGTLAAAALHDRAWVVAAVLGFTAILVGLRTVEECAVATAATLARLETPIRRPIPFDPSRDPAVRQPTIADSARPEAGSRELPPVTNHLHPDGRPGPVTVKDRWEAT